MDTLLETLTEPLPHPSRILDLGAGDGTQAKAMADLGHRVIAVDRRAAPFAHPDVEWIVADIPAWLAFEGGSFDGVLIRHVIQFFDVETVKKAIIPKVQAMLRPGGVLAVEAFTGQPEPPFPSPHPSYWRTADLQALSPGWEVLLARDFEERRPGLDGVERRFRLAQFVARKP